MEKHIKVFGLIFYLLLIQVYPIAHLHAHEHDGHIEIQLSVHPPDVLTDHHHHESDSDNNDHHSHKNEHFDGDQDYTIRTNKLGNKNVSIYFMLVDNNAEIQPIITKVFDNPKISLSPHKYSPNNQMRAPPCYS